MKKVMSMFGAMALIGISIFLIARELHKEDVAYSKLDYCGHFVPFIELQCRKCEANDGIFSDGGFGANRCDFPPKL